MGCFFRQLLALCGLLLSGRQEKHHWGNFGTIRSDVGCPQKGTWCSCGMNMQLPTCGVCCSWNSIGKTNKQTNQKSTVQLLNNIFYLEQILKSQDSHDGQRFLRETAFPCCPQSFLQTFIFPAPPPPSAFSVWRSTVLSPTQFWTWMWLLGSALPAVKVGALQVLGCSGVWQQHSHLQLWAVCCTAANSFL